MTNLKWGGFVFVKKSIRSRLLILTAVLLLLVSAALPALADGAFDHKYIGTDELGDAVGGFQTALLKLQDAAGTVNLSYCVDSSKYIVQDSLYERTNLEDADYFSHEQAALIRAIIRAAYPFTSLDSLRAAANLPELTSTEAVTAAQLAIWKTSNANDLTSPNPRINTLKAWFLALAPVENGTSPVGDISIKSFAQSDGATCSVSYRYSTAAVNADTGLPVALTHGFTADLAALGATVTSNVAPDGAVEVSVTNLPLDANFTFFVTGTQNVVFDAYFYSPQGGRCASQSLVGGYRGDTNLYAEVPFCVDVPGKYSLKIQKYDSKTGEGIQGAVFQLSDNVSFHNPIVYEKTTDAQGYAEFIGLNKGTWYLREKTPPTGYVPDPKTYPIDVDEEPQDVIRFKNSHFGQITILKTDDAGGPVKGATFDIYAGSEKTGVPVLSGLVTDENGMIFAGSMVPGTYLVVETAAPLGYHMSENNQVVVQVGPHDSVTVTMVNPFIRRGKIAVAKEDYTTKAPLAGAVVGLYPTKACNADEELARVTTAVTPVGEDGAGGEVVWQYFDNLLPGTYYVKELAAPEGYIINPAKAVVAVILNEGAEETVIFRNRTRIDTAGNFGLLMLVGLAAVLVTGGALIVFRKKLTKGQ